MGNRITYGLKNVVVWPITATSDAGVPTYGSQIKVPGSTELTLDPVGDTTPFYADDVTFYTGVANNGYSGSLTVANVPDDFKKTILKETADANGVLFENADNTPAEYAMAFEFKGDAGHRRHVFYRCTSERPSVASKTKETKVDPNTTKMSITSMPRLDNSHVKATVEDETSTAYKNWFGTAPYAYADTETA